MKKIEEYVTSIPDFPEPGIIFRDITSVIGDPDGLKLAIDSLDDLLEGVDYDVVAGAESRGFIFGTPVYYAHPTGKIQSFMDRVFYSAKSAFVHKPAAVISSSRRAGSVTSMDVLNKHLSISEMPIVTSNYWNEVHGHTPSDVEQDIEGLDTMYALGKNMAWMLKCIEAGKKAGIEIPQNTKRTTNFIR